MNEESQFENKRSQGDQGGTVSPVPAEIDSRIYMTAERTFLARIWVALLLAFSGLAMTLYLISLTG